MKKYYILFIVSFPLAYILTYLFMMYANKKQGYPVSLKGSAIEL